MKYLPDVKKIIEYQRSENSDNINQTGFFADSIVLDRSPKKEPYERFVFYSLDDIPSAPIGLKRDYSFLDEIYQDFVDRKDAVRKSLKTAELKGSSLYFEISQDGKEDKYAVKTALLFPDYEDNMLTEMLFSINKLNDPSKKELSWKYFDQLKDIGRRLKVAGTKISELVKIQEQFFKTYYLESYMINDKEEGISFFIHPKKESDNAPGEGEVSLYQGTNALEFLRLLKNKNFIDIKYSIIDSLRTEVIDGFSLDDNEGMNMMDRFRKIAMAKEKKVGKVLSIDPSIEELYGYLGKDMFIEKFPLESIVSSGFIIKSLKEMN